MVKLTLWKDQEMTKLRRDIDRLFSRFWSDFGMKLFAGQISEGPSIDMAETEDTLIVRAKLPETNPDDIDISVTSDTLIIRGEKREEAVENGTYNYRVERKVGSFSRTVQLSCKVEVESTMATYKKGVLKIVMPKLKAKKPRGIKIEIT